MKKEKLEEIIKHQKNIIEKLEESIDIVINDLFVLKNMIYKPETREENLEVQRKISSIIKYLGNAKRK